MAGPCSLGRVYDEVNEVLWCMQELRSSVILDLGCLKSVVGTKWMNQLIGRWKEAKRWFKVYPEKEVFRFGSGGTLTSRFAVNLLASFCGKPVVLCFSVVEGECPPLLSRPACTQLGAIFDCGSHTLASKRLGVKNYGLKQTDSGHYIMDIEDFDNFPHGVHIPEDFKLAEGVDAVMWSSLDAHDASLFGSKLANPTDELEAHVSVGEPSGEALQSMRRSRTPKSRLPLHRQRRGSAGDASSRGCGDGRSQRGESLPEGPPRPSRGRRCIGDDDGGDLCPRSSTASSSRGFMGGAGNPYVISPSVTEGQGGAGEAAALCPDGCGGHVPAAHGQGDEDAGTQQGEGIESGGEEGRDGSSDRSSGGISQPFKLLEWRGGDQHSGELSQSDDCLSVEEVAVAAPGEGCGDGNVPRGEVEEESTVVGEAVGAGDRIAVGSSRSPSATPTLTSFFGSDVRRRYDAGEAVESESFTSDETLPTPDGEARFERDREDDEQCTPWEKSEPEPEKSPEKSGRPPRGLSQQMKREVQVAMGFYG